MTMCCQFISTCLWWSHTSDFSQHGCVRWCVAYNNSRQRVVIFAARFFVYVCMWQTYLLRLYRKAHATKTHSHPHNPIRIKQIYHYNVHNLGIKTYTYTNIVISMRYTYMYVWIRRCECVYVWVLLSFAWFFITFTFDSISHAITIMFYMSPSLFLQPNTSTRSLCLLYEYMDEWGLCLS